MAGGAEPNQPNTIHSSCADGTAGSFHTSESIDQLSVRSHSGLLMPGALVQVTATVWAADKDQDALDLYYTSNADNPLWTYLTTLVPTATGLQTLWTAYRLPFGQTQAVRANFRKGGRKSSCSPGLFDDHDDLAFRVR